MIIGTIKDLDVASNKVEAERVMEWTYGTAGSNIAFIR